MKKKTNQGWALFVHGTDRLFYRFGYIFETRRAARKEKYRLNTPQNVDVHKVTVIKGWI